MTNKIGELDILNDNNSSYVEYAKDGLSRKTFTNNKSRPTRSTVSQEFLDSSGRVTRKVRTLSDKGIQLEVHEVINTYDL